MLANDTFYYRKPQARPVPFPDWPGGKKRHQYLSPDFLTDALAGIGDIHPDKFPVIFNLDPDPLIIEIFDGIKSVTYEV